MLSCARPEAAEALGDPTQKPQHPLQDGIAGRRELNALSPQKGVEQLRPDGQQVKGSSGFSAGGRHLGVGDGDREEAPSAQMQLDLSQTREEGDPAPWLDSGRASEGPTVPSLTSAFSVSSTFCPLISRWITLWAWRWARPWDKRAGRITHCAGRGGKEHGGAKLAISPHFRVRPKAQTYSTTAGIILGVCVWGGGTLQSGQRLPRWDDQHPRRSSSQGGMGKGWGRASSSP